MYAQRAKMELQYQFGKGNQREQDLLDIWKIFIAINKYV